ncbi:MAG: FAD-dependent oxidoreductase, partial [Pseudomonadota bacterium]
KSLEKELQLSGVDFFFDQAVKSLVPDRAGVSVLTSSASLFSGRVVNCAGLFSDRIAGLDPELSRARKGPADQTEEAGKAVQILPFRGEYYDLTPEASRKVRGLIYPVPDPAFPFLGVHLTRGVDDLVEAGPNAVLALSREGYSWTDFDADDLLEILAWPGFRELAWRYWRKGLSEVWRSVSKAAFLSSVQQLVPAIGLDDLRSGSAGVRAQASRKYGELLDDFHFRRSSKCLHVLNAPSPAATSSLAIGSEIARNLLVE